jgi:hypothetical protein
MGSNLVPSKKIGRNLCVCTGMEPLGVTINFRQFLIGYTHTKCGNLCLRPKPPSRKFRKILRVCT